MSPTTNAQAAPGRPSTSSRERRCIVTGEVRPIEQLLRFAVDPEGRVVPDIAGRLPGRGLWLVPRHDIILQACERNQFSRAARRAVSVYPARDYSAQDRQPALPGEALSAAVEALLVRRCSDLIGLARRAGQAVMGFEKVQSWLRTLPATGRQRPVLIQARDGAAGSCDRLGRLADAVDAEVLRADVLTTAELGQVFGRDRVVHVGLSAETRLAQSFVGEAVRLAGLRPAVGNGGDESSLNAVEGAGGGDG